MVWKFEWIYYVNEDFSTEIIDSDISRHKDESKQYFEID